MLILTRIVGEKILIGGSRHNRRAGGGKARLTWTLRPGLACWYYEQGKIHSLKEDRKFQVPLEIYPHKSPHKVRRSYTQLVCGVEKLFIETSTLLSLYPHT